MTDKFRETLNLLQENQEEMRLLKTRVRYVYFPTTWSTIETLEQGVKYVQS